VASSTSQRPCALPALRARQRFAMRCCCRFACRWCIRSSSFGGAPVDAFRRAGICASRRRIQSPTPAPVTVADTTRQLRLSCNRCYLRHVPQLLGYRNRQATFASSLRIAAAVVAESDSKPVSAELDCLIGRAHRSKASDSVVGPDPFTRTRRRSATGTDRDC
jgi:hypothetical protein